MNEENNFENGRVKSNKGLIVVIVFLVIAVLALGGYICYDKFFSNNNTNPTNNNQTNNNANNSNNQNVVAEEKELTNSDEINKIYNKLKVLFNVDEVKKTDNKITTILNFYFNGTISNKEKKAIILQNLLTNKKTYNIENGDYNLNSKVLKEKGLNYFRDTQNSSFVTAIKFEDVEKEYKALYNEILDETDELIGDVCPFYFYDAENKIYLWSIECGGALAPRSFNIDKITEKNNIVYVYITTTVTIEGDLNDNYKVTKEEYKTKATFEKINNDYYLKNYEKTN